MKCPKEVSSFVVRFSVKVQGLLLPFCQVLSMPDANLYIAAPGLGRGRAQAQAIHRRFRKEQARTSEVQWGAWLPPAIISKAVDRSLRATIARMLKVRAIKPNARRIQIWQTTPASA